LAACSARPTASSVHFASWRDTSPLALGSAFGFLSASRNFAVYAAIGLLTALFSLVIGVLFLFGQEGVLPAFFGG